MRTLLAFAALSLPAAAQLPLPVYATGGLYNTIELSFVTQLSGLREYSNSPNPWLDYRLEVEFISPTYKVHRRHGFYNTDGAGGDSGAVWSVRFCPTEVGYWSCEVFFHTGTDANLATGTAGLTPVMPPHGSVFNIEVLLPLAGTVTGFREHGPVSPNGVYLQHHDGTYFLKHGMNSPENFLAYRGFDYTRDYGGLPTGASFYHEYLTHVAHWTAGDPNWSAMVVPPGGGSRVASGLTQVLTPRRLHSPSTLRRKGLW